MSQLLDFSADFIDPEDIRAAGYVGVLLYMSRPRPGAEWMKAKPATREYCNSLRAFGLECASIFQFGKPGALTPSDWTTGYPGGVRMAREAAEQHKACGGPDRAPIYFAVDEDISLEQWNTTAFEFFRGVNSVLGEQRTGIYGHSRVCAWAAQDGVIGEAGDGRYWAWQTKAWSSGEMAPEAVLYQREIDKRAVGGVGVDVNDILAPRYGQWSSFTTGGPTVTGHPLATDLVPYREQMYAHLWDDDDGDNTKQLIVQHTTESEGGNTNVIDYLERIRKGSYQTMVDFDGEEVRTVPDNRQAWAAMPQGNRRGVHVCAMGKAAYTRAQWLAQPKLLERTAMRYAEWSRLYGIPLVKISAEDADNGVRGVVGHVDITYAFGESDHTDPGPNFPYDVVIARAQEINGTIDESDDMTPEQEALLKDVQTQLRGPNLEGWAQLGQNDEGQNLTLVDGIAQVLANQSELAAKLDALLANKEK